MHQHCRLAVLVVLGKDKVVVISFNGKVEYGDTTFLLDAYDK